MKITFKSRESGYCNLKLLLMFMVVYGHLIEPMIYDNVILYEIYRIIYIVHMPLFAFLSGLFLKNAGSCLVQAGKAIICYTVFQILYLAMDFFINNRKGTIITPYWHLWYLLSLVLWSLIGAAYYTMSDKWKWLRKWQAKAAILVTAVAVGCVVGGIEEIGYRMSLSRTLVFLPYFLTGILSPSDIEWNKYRKTGVAVCIASVILYGIIRSMLTVEFLWHAGSYGELEFEKGCLLRIICYLLGGGLGFFMLTNMTQRRFFFTKIGSDTMLIYILHVPPVIMFHALWRLDMRYIITAPAAAALIILGVYKIFQWNGQLYIIKERKPKELYQNGGF